MHSPQASRPPFDVSVVVCTYNRAGMLADTLKSWLEVVRDDVRAELIVVDNNSSDETRQVVESFLDRTSDPLKYVFEAQSGLSVARNRGIREAQGGIVAFVDDDIYFDEHWLTRLYEPFLRDPGIDCLGGDSIPVFETARPAWLSDKLLGLYGSTRSGSTERVMTFPEHPYGVNMAFRKEVIQRIGPFNARLGRIKTSLLSNEEREFFYRAHQAGLVTYYTPHAVIYHRIPEERTREEWIVRRVFWQGVSRVAFDQLIAPKGRAKLLKDALVHAKRAVIGGRPWAWRRCGLFYPFQSLPERMRAAQALGVARQSVVEAFQRPVDEAIELAGVELDGIRP